MLEPWSALGLLVIVLAVLCLLLLVAVMPRQFWQELLDLIVDFHFAALDAVASAEPEELHKAPGSKLYRWLDSVAFFIPRTVREPFWDDLLEDRDQMMAQGRSPLFMRLAILCQFAWLFALGAKDWLLTGILYMLRRG